MGAPLTRAELEQLLRDAPAAGFGPRLPIVQEVLQTALAYEKGAARWARHQKANLEAQARYRKTKKEKLNGNDLPMREVRRR